MVFFQRYVNEAWDHFGNDDDDDDENAENSYLGLDMEYGISIFWGIRDYF